MRLILELLICSCLLLAAGCGGTFVGGGDLDRTVPESVGLSSDRLSRIDAAIEGEIAAGRKAGATVLVARRGRIAYHKSFGFADLEARRPLLPGACFRTYSMTKPAVSVALLMLYDQGKFELTDPLEKYIPAMKDVKVWVGTDEDGGMILESPKRKITVLDVFGHTAGFALWALPVLSPSNPVEQAYADAGVDLTTIASMRQLVEEKLPTLPLLHHPGDRWVYSIAHDVQAYLVEYFSGVPIDEYLKTRLFDPLGMRDTFYGDPLVSDPRRTVVYRLDDQGKLVAVDRPLGLSHARFRDHPIGGAGLSTTAIDWARFSQMLLNGGEFNGARILSPQTVELMTTNHLSPEAQSLFGTVDGYGLGLAVRIAPPEDDRWGSVGQFGWGGAASTFMNVDPTEDLVVLVLAQHLPQDGEFLNRVQTVVYEAIVR